MRTLIVVKVGGVDVTNRDVSDPENEQAAINELKAAYPGGDVQFFKHTCGADGCTEKEFTPKVRPLPEPEPLEEKPVEVKPNKPKKNQPPAVRHSGSNNR